jgi:mannitol/fructose-specific phosphotransferase system IIA component (Ntr-type)
LKEPVVFGHPKNDPVKIVIGLCAVDHQSHLEALTELVDVLGNEEKVKNIKDAKSSEEVIAIIKRRK